MSNDKDYEVGYGKPPKKNRFKKGKSGNPKGRKKGSKNLSSLYMDILEEKIMITENGIQKNITKQEGIVRRNIADALKGKDKAVERVLKYAPQTENEETKYTIEEWVDKWDFEALNDEELDIVWRLLGLDEQKKYK